MGQDVVSMNMMSRETVGADETVELLEQFRADGIAAFARVSENLSSTYAGTTALTDKLADLASTCTRGLDEQDPLTGVVNALGVLIEQVAPGVQTEAGQHQNDKAQAGLVLLGRLHRESMKLTAIASLTAINSHSLGQLEFVPYVASLKQTALALQEGVANVTRGLEQIILARRLMAEAMESASDTLGYTHLALMSQQANRARMADSEKAQRRQMEHLARRVADGTRDEVQALIVGIQFSDFFAQRVEHLISMLSLPQAGQNAVLQALVARQIEALREDCTQNLASVRGSLMRIGTLSDEVGRSFGASADMDSAEQYLSLRRAALAMTIDSRSTVETVIRTAETTAQSVEQETETAKGRFRALGDVITTMTLSAHNARLITSRSLEARGALTVLAVAVHESVELCSQQIRDCQQVFTMVTQENAVSARTGTSVALAEFGARVDACALSLQQTREDLTRIGTLQAGISEVHSALSELLTAGLGALDGVDDVLGRLDRLRANLATLTGPALDGPEFDQIHSLYSMERERQVHDAFFGRMAPPPAEGSGKETYDLEDILF